MRLEIYTIFDQAVDAYMQPFFVRTRGEAIRSFTDAVNDGKTQFNRYPDQFYLVFHGFWHDDTGLFVGVPEDRPVTVLNAKDVLNSSS